MNYFSPTFLRKIERNRYFFALNAGIENLKANPLLRNGVPISISRRKWKQAVHIYDEHTLHSHLA